MTRLTASSVGNDAWRALRAAGEGEVIALFRRSFYLRLPEGVVCVGAAEIGAGPLNLLCDGGMPPDLRGILAPGDPAEIQAACIVLPALRVDLAGAEVWTPDPLPPFRGRSAERGVSALCAALPRVPEGGLGALLPVGHMPDCPILRSALPAVNRIAAWAGAAAPGRVPADAVARLLGLGPGLTPSGDDCLAGMAVGLGALGLRAHHDALAAEIGRQAPALTNEISLAHLAAALRGGLRADLLGLLAAVLEADAPAIGAHVAVLAAQDHHSPWDALAGFVLVLRAALGAPRAGINPVALHA